MSICKVCKVAVNNTTYDFDKEFTYKIPENMYNEVVCGIMVKVPFGKGNKTRQAIVLEVLENYNTDLKLKYIKEVVEKNQLINNEMIELARFMKKRYFCTLFEAINTMIPSALHYTMVDTYSICSDILPTKRAELTSKEKDILEYLSKKTTPTKRTLIESKFELDRRDDLLFKLEKKGVIYKSNNIIRRGNDASIRMIKLKSSLENIKLTGKQTEVCNLLKVDGAVSQKEILYYTGVTSSVINSLIRKGIVEIFDREVFRIPYNDNANNEKAEDIILTEEQNKAFINMYNEYKEEKPSVSLLYGITGSGKTSVFTKLMDECVHDNKGVILMVPEIALTSQVIFLLKQRYKDKVAVFHSGLSMGERLDEYKRVKTGKAKIAIGTRSAVFAPLDNIGLIIIDEEQEYTYKSESNPRFNAIDIAKFRVKYHNSLLVLSSATPSIESYYYAKTGRYSLNRLKNRYGKASLPEVKVVDMNEEILDGNSSIISNELIKSINNSINNNKQVILLLNRRGYNTFVRCKSCKEVITCPNCSIAMTYHSSNDRLMCHYCGYSIKFTEKCPNCGEKSLTYGGLGTQRLEDEIKKLIPEARVLRVDADSTMTKFSHTQKFNSFRNKEYDIMIGTQMVAKGLDFEDVDLVGVLNADQALYSDDFRSYERAFDLITQVVGRSGRRSNKGTAIIQTFTPENVIIDLASKQDYDAFYDTEISIRQSMLYPPFCDICIIGFVGKSQNDTLKKANEFFEMLKIKSNEYKTVPIRAFRVSPANLVKVNSKYRYKIILKTRNNKIFRNMMSELIIEFNKNNKNINVSAFVDINPYNIM